MRCVPAALVLALLCGASSAARGASIEYAIAVEDGRQATFEVPVQADYAGAVTLEATWSGARLLFFRFESVSGVEISHRSGPSPQRIEIPVDESRLAQGASFRLTIKALPARGAIDGMVRVTLPDSPAEVARREAALHPPPPPPPPPPAWTLPRAAPAGAGESVAGVFDAVEAFRRTLMANRETPDDCAWQESFLRYAASARDRLAGGGTVPEPASLRYFERLTAAVRLVDGVRVPKEVALAGPPPEDREDLRDWMIARSELTRPIERKLDQLGELLRGGHAPSLAEEAWIPRLNACLTACERHFDERVRLGREAEPPNGELAAAQWTRILAAARVLDSFVKLGLETAPTQATAQTGHPGSP